MSWLRTGRNVAARPPLLMAAQELPGGARIQSVAYGHEYRQDDWPALAQAPDGSMWAAWLSFEGRRDDVAIRHYREGKWQNMLWVPGTSGDSWMPHVAVDRENRVWVVWSQQASGNWDICARRFDPARQEWSKLERLSTHPLPDIHPRLAVDGKGRFAVVWQGFRDKNSNIFLALFDGERWTPEVRVTREARNDWFPAVAFDSRGVAWVVYDSYRNGSYDVMLSSVRNGVVEGGQITVSDSPANDFHATVAVDAADRVWVAWEAAPANWGKDTGYQFRNTATGAPLGGARELRLRCRVNNQWREPSESLQAAFPRIASQPHVFIDGGGSVWVIAKVRPASGAAYWEYHAAHLEGGRWSRPFALPNSKGRSSTRAAGLAAANGQFWLAWPTDNREAPRWPRPRRQQVYVGVLEPAAKSSPDPVWRDVAEEGAAPAAPHRDEGADVRALRGYSTTIGGKRARLLRGDFHRHTELSWDGAGLQDGSLTDFYRYMLDAAALDFGASTDHQAGAWPYWQWYTEKMTDMFHVPGAYVAIYGYERSPQWPKGNRNIFWAKRSDIRITPLYMKDGATGYSLPPTPIGDESGVGMRESPVNDTALLYEDVRATSGLTIPHTTATFMGTDWQEFDTELEPVVEIFQGARTSYEAAGAPLVADPVKDAEHINTAQYKPEGMVSVALAKGYKLGIIASSDHGSTHISYAMVYTEDPTRQGILDAFRKRHVYGATDNIILEARMGRYFMGDEFSLRSAEPLRVKARATGPVRRAAVLRDSRQIYETRPTTQEFSFEFLDGQPPRGRHAYYVRLEQENGMVAWSSPFFVTYE